MGQICNRSNTRHTHKLQKKMFKYFSLLGLAALSVEAKHKFEVNGVPIKLKGRAFLVANPPKFVNKYTQINAEALNGGYWNIIQHAYGNFNGIKSSDKYNSDKICVGDGWMIHNALASESDSGSAVFTHGQPKKGFAQYCDAAGCHADTNEFRDEIQFTKAPEGECLDSHIWATNDWFAKLSEAIITVPPVVDVDSEEPVVTEPEVTTPEATRSPETTQAQETEAPKEFSQPDTQCRRDMAANVSDMFCFGADGTVDLKANMDDCPADQIVTFNAESQEYMMKWIPENLGKNMFAFSYGPVPGVEGGSVYAPLRKMPLAVDGLYSEYAILWGWASVGCENLGEFDPVPAGGKDCVCPSGERVPDTECYADGGIHCNSCDEGYHLHGFYTQTFVEGRPPMYVLNPVQPAFCTENICNCSNGEGKVGIECETHGDNNQCATCYEGFEMDNWGGCWAPSSYDY